MLEELVAQPHCLHVHVDIWQLNMFKPKKEQKLFIYLIVYYLYFPL